MSAGAVRTTGAHRRWWDVTTRVLLGVGLVAAVTWAVVHDRAVCSVADPATCGPDPVAAVAQGSLLAVPVLLFFAPALAYGVLVAFAVLDVWFDPEVDAHGPFVALAVAAVVALGVHRWSQARRVGGPAVPVADRPQPSASAAASAVWRWVAVVLAALTLLSGLGGWWSLHADAVHRERAQRLPAVIVETDPGPDADDPNITVHLDSGRVLHFWVLDLGPYPVRSTTLVAVDPSEPSWHELVAEPRDPTGGLLLASGVGVLALGTGWRAAERSGLRFRRPTWWLARAPGLERLVARAHWGSRAQASLLACGGMVGGPLGMWVADTWPERVTAGLGAAQTAFVGTGRWRRGLEADADRLRLRTTAWTRTLPWPAVTGIQVVGGTLFVADERGDAQAFGPFDPAPGVGVLATSEVVAARLTRWREQAGRATTAAPVVRSRPGGSWWVAAGVLAAEVVTVAVSG